MLTEAFEGSKRVKASCSKVIVKKKGKEKEQGRQENTTKEQKNNTKTKSKGTEWAVANKVPRLLCVYDFIAIPRHIMWKIDGLSITPEGVLEAV